MTSQHGHGQRHGQGHGQGDGRRRGLLLAGALSLAGLAALAGCSDDGWSEGDERPGDLAADAATRDGEALGASLAAQLGYELAGEPMPRTLARQGAILLALDSGELAPADLALARVDDPMIQDLAAHMRAAHAGHAEEIERLLAARGMAPAESEISGALRREARAGLDELRASPRHDVDVAYLRLQVRLHAAGGVLVNRLYEVASSAAPDHAPDDAPLRELLESTRGVVAAHRRAAEAMLRAR